MSITWASACLMTAAGLSFSTPSFAQDSSPALSPTSDWKVSKKSDRCKLARTFGEGDSLTRLFIEKGGNEPTFNLTLIGKPVANPVGRLISLQFGPHERPIGRHYISASARSGTPAIVMFGADFAPAQRNDDDEIVPDRVDAERLAAIKYLRIERAGLTPFLLDTGSLVDAMALLSECGKALAGAFAVAGTGESKGPIAIGDRQDWVQRQDYPSLMLGYRQEGNIGFRLTVNDQGKPTFCVIRSATIPQMFDDAVCRALLKRARFEPALDWQGNPVPSYYSSSVRFTIR